MSARLVVSVHDVAPATFAQTRDWLAALHARQIPASLLVIPGPWRGAALSNCPSLQRYLHERQDIGDDIVLHGWRHKLSAAGRDWRSIKATLMARGAAEFALISQPDASRLLRHGRQVLADAGLSTRGFTAPGWLHSVGAIAALRAEAFAFTTTHTGLLDLRTGRTVPGFAFSHRPGVTGEILGRHVVRHGPRVVACAGGLIRIALHPDDLGRPALPAASLRAIDEAMQRGACPTTYQQVWADQR